VELFLNGRFEEVLRTYSRLCLGKLYKCLYTFFDKVIVSVKCKKNSNQPDKLLFENQCQMFWIWNVQYLHNNTITLHKLNKMVISVNLPFEIVNLMLLHCMINYVCINGDFFVSGTFEG